MLGTMHLKLPILLGLLTSTLHAQNLPVIELDEAWKKKITAIAPTKPQVAPKKERKVLIFSLDTGFRHWCNPHSEAVLQILGKQSGAYTAVASRDIEDFRAERLKEFDAVVFNNTSPDKTKRNVFHDVLISNKGEEGAKYKDMPMADRQKLATTLYQNIVDYISNGGGVVMLHGAGSSFAQSEEFSAIIGGSFTWHPPQQDITLKICNPEHALTKPFGGKPFVHVDEPYVYGGAYEKFNFTPLLEMKREGIKDPKKKGFHDMVRYAAWIKRHEKGRVFVCAPPHNAQSFERLELLQFILNGMQYALGDLECDDTSRPKK